MSKTKQNVVKMTEETQKSLYRRVLEFKTELGKFIKEKDLNFYYDVDNDSLEIVAKTRLLNEKPEDVTLTGLEKKCKYSPNLRIALFFGFISEFEVLVGEYSEAGYELTEPMFEEIVRGILFEEDFEKFIKIDELNSILRRKLDNDK